MRKGSTARERGQTARFVVLTSNSRDVVRKSYHNNHKEFLDDMPYPTVTVIQREGGNKNLRRQERLEA